MEVKICEEYIDHSLGFPVKLNDVPMRKIRGEWVIDIDPNRFEHAVLWGLVHKRGALCGSEIRFIRHWMEQTLSEFGDELGVTHAAVSKWEKQGSSPTNMAMGTDFLVRFKVLAELPDEVWEAYEDGSTNSPSAMTYQEIRELVRKITELENQTPPEPVELQLQGSNLHHFEQSHPRF
jgi:hypothetical protein